MNTYLVISPVNRQFLESKGVGCKLGAPNRKRMFFRLCRTPSILYNGPVITLTELNAKSSFVFTKNETYWDSANVNAKKIKFVYDDQKDPYSLIKVLNKELINKLHSDLLGVILRPMLINMKELNRISNLTLLLSVWYFNLNRKNYEHTNHQSEESKANTRGGFIK